jgi:hypothetical protein
MKERAKALLGKNQNELSAARTFYVSLDRADNVIEGGPAFEKVLNFRVAAPSRVFEGAEGLIFLFWICNLVDGDRSGLWELFEKMALSKSGRTASFVGQQSRRQGCCNQNDGSWLVT